MKSMHIVHLSAEMAPIAKVGGLGDVVFGQSRELIKLGHKVEVILPKYSCLHSQYIKSEKMIEKIMVEENASKYNNFVWHTNVETIPTFLIKPKHPKGYFHESSIYLNKSNTPRFIYFCKAALEFLLTRNEKIDILHLHDWHTSLAAVLYKEVYSKKGLKVKGIVLNIHNVGYVGRCSSNNVKRIGLKGKALSSLKDPNPRYFDKVNLLKGGLLYSDQIIAVSPGYAKEILEEKKPLCKIIQKNRKKFQGILNGIDLKVWNPKTDPHIHYHYHKGEAIEKIVKAKEKNKTYLRKKLKLKEENRPLICCVSRLVAQKGPDLIQEGLKYAVKRGAQAVILGASPTEKIQKSFEALQKHFSKSPHFHIHFHYNDALSRQIYAASDFIIMPSLYEPCGLSQLIAFRYGCVPIVRSIGGLSDTVFDLENSSHKKPNGFTFVPFGKAAFKKTLERALIVWYRSPKTYRTLIKNGMSKDYSWKTSAEEYLKAYKKLIN